MNKILLSGNVYIRISFLAIGGGEWQRIRNCTHFSARVCKNASVIYTEVRAAECNKIYQVQYFFRQRGDGAPVRYRKIVDKLLFLYLPVRQTMWNIIPAAITYCAALHVKIHRLNAYLSCHFACCWFEALA
ncbi:MAG: hypothetical protein JWP81_3838 [Ferruginibacter sp.]|nr:hypothetical protein [Ferruginibacter sp.]